MPKRECFASCQFEAAETAGSPRGFDKSPDFAVAPGWQAGDMSLMNNTHSDARMLLREATRAEHDRVDAAFSAYDLTDREGYAAFLQAQAEAFLPLERALDEAGATKVVADWPERRRSAALQTDLAALGAEEPSASALPAFGSPSEILGAIYVLEGSRLGGVLLARGVPEGLPQAFLNAGDSRLWRNLIAQLELSLQTEAQINEAIVSAKSVFALFENGARRYAKGVKLV